jgi:nucleotide-binding universal stress UspA family protein
VAGHLSWHGVAAKAIVRHRGISSLGDALIDAAQDTGAGLIVMGGYGHSRYQEVLIGGMTRHVIRQSPLPVLLMH